MFEIGDAVGVYLSDPYADSPVRGTRRYVVSDIHKGFYGGAPVYDLKRRMHDSRPVFTSICEKNLFKDGKEDT